MRPVCVKDGIEMIPTCKETVIWHPHEPEQPGVDLIDFVQLGDLYKCPKCGLEVVTGGGRFLTADRYTQEQLKEIRYMACRIVKILRMEV